MLGEDSIHRLDIEEKRQDEKGWSVKVSEEVDHHNQVFALETETERNCFVSMGPVFDTAP